MHILLLVLLAILVVGAIVSANIWRDNLPVARVGIEGVKVVPSADIYHLAAVPMESRLYDVPLTQVRNRVLRNPFVKDAAVHRDPPDRILIQIEERIPLAVIVSGGMFYVDAEGMVLPLARSDSVFDLPVITGTAEKQQCVIGKRLSHQAIREALLVVRAAQLMDEGLYRRISEVHIDPSGDLLLYTADTGVPVILGHGDMISKLQKFQDFWTAVVTTRGAQTLASVDLRFADQVVVRWTTQDEQMAN
jgi:cell division protein FtsQ